MRKEDFLEILKDYLKKDFSEDEVIDILRDYEEYFVNGAIEGKSEIEIISSLGSPKEIANELLFESNIKNDAMSDFPGGPVIKTPCFQCRGQRFD